MSIDSDRIRYRLLTPDDQVFISHINVVATYRGRKPDAKLPKASTLFKLHPDIAKYSEGFGKPGDMRLVAEDVSGNLVGAIWGREYDRTKDENEVMKSHPFEITVGVRDSLRGKGIGRQLLDSFAMMAWLKGKDELSLGVHIENSGARHLYEAVGFTPLVDDTGAEALLPGDFTAMVRKLGDK